MASAEKLELLRLLEEKHRRRARDDLNAFCQYIEIPGVPVNDDPDCERFYPDNVTPAAHHRLINSALMQVEAGEIRRLMLFMPPGSAKSSYASVVFPTWYMGRRPSRNAICASYGTTLAQKFGRKCRQITRSRQFREIFDAELVSDNKAADDWALTNASTYMAGGILSGITGNRADLLLIDDPIRGRQDADSATIREKVWEEYKSSLRTRLKPHGSIVLVQTRWHEDDLAGRILPKDWNGESGWVEGRDGERWYVICLPAQCEREDDPLGRKIGDWLWTDWFSPEHWEQERRTQGSRNWDALYQQRPRPADGGIFKESWVKRYRTPPANPAMIVQSVDTAYKPGKLNDPSVVATWAVTDSGYYLLHVWRERAEYPRLKRNVLGLARAHSPDALLIEDKASGQSLIQELRDIPNPPPVIAIEPEGDKLTRASVVSPMVEAGLVHLPEAADWLGDYESELFGFPLSTHDDQVDSTTQFLSWIKTHATRFEAYGSGQRRAGLAADNGSTLGTGFGYGTMGGSDTSGFL